MTEAREKEVLQVGAAFPGGRLDGKGAHHRRDGGGAVFTHGGRLVLEEVTEVVFSCLKKSRR